MTDSKWWNSYFALQGPSEEDSMATDIASAEACLIGIQAELDLEEHWVRRYLEMTGPDGRWIYTRGLFSRVESHTRCFLIQARRDVECFLSKARRHLECFLSRAGSLLSQAASALLLVLWAVLPFVPGLLMVALLATITFFVLQFLSHVIVEVVQLVIGAIADIIHLVPLFVEWLIRFVSSVVQLVISVVSAVIHAIAEFVSNAIDAIRGGM